MHWFGSLVVVLALSACAAEVRQLPPRLDPSNPDAPSSPLPEASKTLAPDQTEKAPAKAPSEQSEPAHRHAGHGSEDGPSVTPDAGAPRYTCPMHPEVVSETPDSCPKCGMKLVLRSATDKKVPPPAAPSKQPPSTSAPNRPGTSAPAKKAPPPSGHERHGDAP